jgi:hypothetical protein
MEWPPTPPRENHDPSKPPVGYSRSPSETLRIPAAFKGIRAGTHRGPPPSGLMKPNPRSVLKNFTVPVAIYSIPWCPLRLRRRCAAARACRPLVVHRLPRGRAPGRRGHRTRRTPCANARAELGGAVEDRHVGAPSLRRFRPPDQLRKCEKPSVRLVTDRDKPRPRSRKPRQCKQLALHQLEQPFHKKQASRIRTKHDERASQPVAASKDHHRCPRSWRRALRRCWRRSRPPSG